ncbi:polyhydroxybutyrate depolymerase [Flavobacterium nitrogenifigens]|uniref:Polyhydroxybutyrate depolymerase n=2 Tax=Flavobacterium TaxID=237 RepID=A0A7W7IXB0_9FLAO|nr:MULTISPECIES: esterase [Flavobacterium]MBB4802150.1 polyhydroxybutyrate depolymerase [Flavobacterium nitrogenifigens]MBB6387108.1 polyhydroxybutyrate depolymerase [Flavobacterium notoginsengisoli]
MIKHIFAFLFITSAAIAQQKSIPVIKHWQVDGLDREALIYIPSTAQSKLSPVIFLFHGHGGNMQEMFDSHNFQDLWPEAIVIVPQGLKTPGQLVDKAGKFSGWQQQPGDMDDRDIHFFDTMVQSIADQYKIDKQHIFATGHSNGGSFTYLLWAMRGNVLAAVAPSAAVAFKFNNLLEAKPVMHIMGENDNLVKPLWQKMQISSLLKLNKCSKTGRAYDSSTVVYSSEINAPVAVYKHPGGHVYPSDADKAVVKFFKNEFL